MARTIAGALGLILAVNGLAMLFAGLWWYGAVPGVTATGPYNPHFVRDIGAAYLVAGGALSAYAAWPQEAWSGLAAAAGFLTLHAAVHVYDAVCGTHPLADVLRDAGGVYLPAALALWLAVRPISKESPHAEVAA